MSGNGYIEDFGRSKRRRVDTELESVDRCSIWVSSPSAIDDPSTASTTQIPSFQLPQPSRADTSSLHCGSSYPASDRLSGVGTPQEHETGTGTPIASKPSVCYGMLANMAVKLGGSFLEVAPYTSVISVERRLLLAANGNNLGCLSGRDAHVLGALQEQQKLDLQMFCTPEYSASEKQGRSARRAASQIGLCAIIYGPADFADTLGDFLDRCDVFLQDPVHCDRNVEYQNPHRLFAPLDEICTTWHLNESPQNDLELYENPLDLLSGLECTFELDESPTPTPLSTELFRHQRQALSFMLRRERGWAFHSSAQDLWRIEDVPIGVTRYVNNVTGQVTSNQPEHFYGGIFADHMGLGKSLSMIALIATDKDCPRHYSVSPLTFKFVQSTLLIVRAPLLKMWQDQFSRHISAGKLTWAVHHGSNRLKSFTEIANYDIVVTSYNTLAAEWKKKDPLLFSVHWRRLILDEAHDIRDSRRATCKCVCALEAHSRWAVTGTPIQNRLLDMATLFQFLRVHPYNTSHAFQSLINELRAQYSQRDAMERLRYLLRCIMLRRSISTVELPERRDMLSRLDFGVEEQRLYDTMKQSALQPRLHVCADGQDETLASQTSALETINKLRMVCNLGTLLPNKHSFGYQESTSEWSEVAAQELFNGFVAAGSAACKLCSSDLGAASTEVADSTAGDTYKPEVFECGWLVCGGCRSGFTQTHCGCQCRSHGSFQASTLSSTIHLGHWTDMEGTKMPTKIRAVVADVAAHMVDEKSIIFSFWTSTLDLIEQELKNKRISYIRYDGSVAQTVRNKALNRFNKDPGIRVALLTISCGAVGLDLTAASRAYLMEPHWNPSVEQQALARVHRMGQKKPVTTIRYIMRGTLEEHVVKVQQGKQELSQLLLADRDGSSDVDRLNLLKSILSDSPS